MAKLKCGPDWELEEQAAEFLAAARRKEKELGIQVEDNYLTEGQLFRRRYREVYNKNGFPETHFYSGLFRRVYNPAMNKQIGATSDGE